MRAFSRVWIAWLLLQAGVVATVIVTMLVVRDAQTEKNIETENAADEIVTAIDARMRAYVEVVYAVRGLFVGAMAGFQIPATMLSKKVGASINFDPDYNENNSLAIYFRSISNFCTTGL